METKARAFTQRTKCLWSIVLTQCATFAAYAQCSAFPMLAEYTSSAFPTRTRQYIVLAYQPLSVPLLRLASTHQVPCSSDSILLRWRLRFRHVHYVKSKFVSSKTIR